MASGTAFRAAERRFRALALEDLPDDVIDVHRREPDVSEATRVDADVGGRVVAAYELVKRPGVVLIPGVLLPAEQWEWASVSLMRYSGSRSNLHAEYDLPMRGDAMLWDRGKDAAAMAVPRAGRPAASYADLLRRLRWTTLGHHYDWTAHSYVDGDGERFPPELALLSQRVAASVGHREFVAEAAIVNYYGVKDTLMGHSDYSERDYSAPLLSFSLGCAALFLVGGTTRDEEPSAMVLRSGDCVIMRGQARLAYHGVPRIYAGSSPSHFTQRALVTDDEQRIAAYMTQSRINLNVRQVDHYGAS